jgi:hypothetical protein
MKHVQELDAQKKIELGRFWGANRARHHRIATWVEE